MSTRTQAGGTHAGDDRPRRDPDLARAGEAGGQHQPVRRPDHDQPVEQRLDDVGLDDRGDVLEDELRDRRSRGGPPGEGGQARPKRSGH